MAKYRRQFRKNKHRPLHRGTPRSSSVRIRTLEQIARDATRPVRIKIPGYRYVNGQYVSSAEFLIDRALNPLPFFRPPGTPIQFRRQEPGW